MKMKILLILLLSVSVKLFAVASDGTKNFLGWSGDGTNTLTTTDFKLTGYDGSGNFNMNIDSSIAYGSIGGSSSTCVYKLSVDGVNTGSFQLSGISANEYGSLSDYTNVKLVGNTTTASTVESLNTIIGTGLGVAKENYNTADLGLANFSGVDLVSIELRFDLEIGSAHSCSNMDFNSFTIVNAKAPVTAKPEPTNYPTSFVATADSTSQITTAWTDSVTGSQAPDGYLVMCSTTASFGSIIDGTAQSNDTNCNDGAGVQNITHGTQTVAWTGLNAGTPYYYKIFPYTNSGADIDYKTDGVVPTANATTLSPNNVPNTTLPATPTVKEDDIDALIAGISIADGDTDNQTVTLSVTNGTVSLNSITGLSITTGDGIDDSSMIFNGTLANINSALNNLKFSPTADFDGTATIQVQTNDGNGGTDDDTLSVTVNNAPEVSSITRVGSSPTNATSVDFTVTFSESVSNVNTADFELTTTGTASGTIASVSGASGTTITVTVNTISGDGTLKLNLKDNDTIINTNSVVLGGTGITSSGNGSYTSGESYTIDTVAPTVTITSNDSALKAGDVATLTFTLSEASTNFILGDITVTGGSLSNFATTNNIVYTADFTPTASSTTGATVDVALNTFTDLVGNSNTASSQFSMSVNTVTPTVTITTNDSALNAEDVAILTFTLSEASTDFALDDITVVGGALFSFIKEHDTKYIALFLPTASSTTGATVDVGANKFTNTVGNGNTASNHLTMSVDTIVPTVTITSTHSALKAGEVATLTFTLSENSTDFILGDITVTGGILGSLSGSGTVYTADFTPTASSTTGATVDVALNTFTDLAGNSNTASNQLTMSVDTIVPTVVITSNDSALKIGDVATLTFTLSETSNDFASGDITVTGGTLSNFAGSGTNYTVSFTPTASSTTGATVDVVANKFTDSAGNGNTASSQFSMSVDTIMPTVVITSTHSALKVGETATITFTFSEGFTGFSPSEDITVTGGILGSLSGSGTVNTATFTPTASSTTGATVDITANKFTDLAGNSNTASNQLTMSVDTVAPTVTITSTHSALKAGEVATLTFTLSENSTDFILGDITAVGGALGNFTGSGTTYTADFTPTASSSTGATIDVIADKFTDTAGNGNTASSQFSMSVDTVAPTVTITSTHSALKIGDVATLTFTLSEASTDFILGDITVTGGSLSNFATTNNIVYTATFTPTASITTGATVDVIANKFTDTAGNGNTASSQFSMSVDTVAPTVTITSTHSALKAGEVATLTFTFSEEPDNVSGTDVTVTGGTFIPLPGGSNTVFIGSFTPTASSTTGATVDITANKFTDLAGNSNTASNHLTMSVDTIVPTVTITSTHSALKIGEVATLTFTLSESSTDFILGDITAVGGTISNFTTTNNIVYTADFTPTASSTTGATVDVVANKFTDTAGNGNTASSQFSMSVDTVAPTLISTSPTPNATGVSTTTNIVITMSEDVIKGSGDIMISDMVNPPSIIPISDSSVTISGNIVTIDLSGIMLSFDTNYVWAVSFGALKDSNGNGFLPPPPYGFTTTTNAPPSVANAVSGQLVDDNNSITPFSTITLVDNEGDDVNISITLDDDSKGTLSATSIARGTIVSVQAQLRAIVFTPTPNRVAVGGTETTTFTIRANDGISDSTPDINTTVIAKSINDAPVINTVFNSISITENNGTSKYDINISDVDVLSELNLTIESNNTSILTVTPNWSGELNASNWIKDFNLTTVANANGRVKITIRTTDGDVNVTKTFDVIVTAVDYAPVLEAITDINKNEDDSSFTVELNTTDSDGDAISYSVLSSDETIVTVSEDNGILTIVPITNANGIATIEVNATANDKSDIVSFDINITAVNDTPSIDTNFANISLDEDNGTSSYDINISDIERSDLNLTVESNNTAILMVTPSWSELISEANYQTNNFNLTTVAHANGKVKITITVNDGELSSTKTFDVTVRAVNDAPTINTLFNDMSIVENNGSSSYDINISDIELSDLTLTIESNNTSILTVTPNWSGALDSSNWINSFNLTTVQNANGVVRITITVDDGELNTKKTFDINVTAIDYAPILEAIADINKNEDDSSFDVTLNASDSDGDTISYQATSSNALIATVIENSGVLTITPLANQYGVVTIEVVASANGKSDTKSFKVNIASVNDAPTITINENITIDENQEQILSFSYTDVDGDNIAVTTTKNPQNGTVTRTDSTITYTPYGDFSGSDSFILSFDDGNGGVVDKTIVVVVNPINSEVNITVASITKLFSNLKDTNVTVDKESGETTIIADSNVTTEIGFVYRAIVVIEKNGKAKTKIVRVNLATQEETLIDFTLQNGIWYKEGNNIKISIKDGMLQIKITTKINTPLIIN